MLVCDQSHIYVICLHPPEPILLFSTLAIIYQKVRETKKRSHIMSWFSCATRTVCVTSIAPGLASEGVVLFLEYASLDLLALMDVLDSGMPCGFRYEDGIAV